MPLELLRVPIDPEHYELVEVGNISVITCSLYDGLPHYVVHLKWPIINIRPGEPGIYHLEVCALQTFVFAERLKRCEYPPPVQSVERTKHDPLQLDAPVPGDCSSSHASSTASSTAGLAAGGENS